MMRAWAGVPVFDTAISKIPPASMPNAGRKTMSTTMMVPTGRRFTG
jgi:hypothetical protein